MISIEMDKCVFVAINGDVNDRMDFILPFGRIQHKNFVTLLGSNIDASGNVKNDLEHQMNIRMKRFNHICRK